MKVGDKVIVIESYPPFATNPWYKPGDILTISDFIGTSYIFVKEFNHNKSNGITIMCVRKLTKLDKALA